jgi:sortase A
MRARRTLSLAFVGSGAALLVYATGAWAASALARDRARAEWESLVASRAAREARASVQAARGELADGAPIGRIRIDRLGLDEIIVEGTSDAALRAGPGHLRGTPLPGEAGNSVVSAHRDRQFRALAGVRVGDTITTDGWARTTRWVVRERRVVPADARSLVPSAAPTLTLTTCWPIRWFGPAPERLIVHASPIAG